MKILFIITKSEIGGAQKFVSEQIKMLCDNGFQLYLATNEHGWLTQKTNSYVAGMLIEDKIQKMISVNYLFSLITFITTNKIDLIICNSANAGLYGRIASFLARKKSIYVSHGWSSIYNGGKLSYFLNKVEMFLSYFGDKVLCISENDFYAAKNIINIPNKKLTLIKNCIYSVVKSPIVKEKRDTIHIKILFLGRLSRPKRVDLLIDAVKLIPNVSLYVVGDGNIAGSLKNKVKEENIKNVEFLGKITNFSSFDDYDIFALISDSEGLPMSAIEAMSCGMPLLLSNIGGCKPLINNNGELVDNNVNSILIGLSNCISQLEVYSQNSYEMFVKEFDLEHNKDKYIKLYKSTIIR